jgi:hypothetical protein
MKKTLVFLVKSLVFPAESSVFAAELYNSAEESPVFLKETGVFFPHSYESAPRFRRRALCFVVPSLIFYYTQAPAFVPQSPR